MLVNRIWIVFLACFLLQACSESIPESQSGNPIMESAPVPPSVDLSKVESVKEYMNWVENPSSQLMASKSLGNVSFSAMLKPALYSTIKNTGRSILQMDEEEVKELVNNQSALTEIEFKISSEDCSDELLKCVSADMSEYQQNVSYFAFNANNDAYLVIGKDTLPCVMHHWERVYDTKGDLTLQLVFDASAGSKTSDTVQLVYYDRVFGYGLIKLLFGHEA